MTGEPVAAAIDCLPSLAEELRRAGWRPTKALGQNFLLDEGLLARIVRLSGIAEGDHVYEVGPGPGGLTRQLLRAGALVTAVERDRRALAILDRLAEAAPGRLRLVAGDALQIDERQLLADGAHLVANLPYNVGTPLLVRWLRGADWPPWWRSATLMFQKEVAERLAASPGSRAYGRLSVLAQLRSEVTIALRLPPGAFTPAPKVESAVVRLRPLPAGADLPLAEVERLTAAAFGQRRKMLRQSLKGVAGAVAALGQLGIDSARRPETLSVGEFIALARALRSTPACN